jgi:putative hydrolase of the HAD superfamily
MKESLRGVQGIIFELDSVLFDKSDWVIPGAEYAAQQMKLDTQRAVKLAHDYIQQHGGADPQIYNYILVGCGQFDTAMNIRAFTSLVNQFQPRSRSIHFFPGVEEALKLLRRNYKLAVVTDGPPDTQRRKIIALGLQEIINLIVYTDEIEGIKSRLPDPRPLLLATSEMRVRPQQSIFVGHNPIKHFLRTRELGFFTVRVLSGEYGRQDYLSDDHRADFDLPSVARLPELLGYVMESDAAPAAVESPTIPTTPSAVELPVEEGRGMSFELLKQLTDPTAPRVQFNTQPVSPDPKFAQPPDAVANDSSTAQPVGDPVAPLTTVPQLDPSSNGGLMDDMGGLLSPRQDILSEKSAANPQANEGAGSRDEEENAEKPVVLDFSTM